VKIIPRLYLVLILSIFPLLGCKGTTRHDFWENREDYLICIPSRPEMETLKQKITLLANRDKMTIYDRSADSEKELQNLNVTKTLKNTKLPVIFMNFEKPKEYHIAIDNTGTGNGFGITFSYNEKIRPKLLDEILGYTNKYRSIVRTEYGQDGYPVKGHLVTDCQ
jgi:hypothetical protein